MIRIAEAKKQSPHNGILSELPMFSLIARAIGEGDWVSVHTEKPWGGYLDTIKIAKSLTTKPVMAKGIHKNDRDIERAFRAGADYVLCVGRLSHIKDDRIIFEPLDLSQAHFFGPKYKKMIWNRRDLNNGYPKPNVWEEVRRSHKGWLGCASFGEPFPKNADACLFSVK